MFIKLAKAFSALELVIVLTILSLLISVVISASNIKKKANLNSFIKETNVILTSALSFRLKYNGLPGDIADGYSLFGSNCGTEAQCNGNGDGYIALDSVAESDEMISSFIHLSLSGIIDSSYDRTDYEFKYKNKGTAKLHYVSTSDNYQINNNAIIALSVNSDYQFLEPYRARQVDYKIDDGLPEKGVVTYFSNGNAGCVSGSAYIDDDDNKKCGLVFVIGE
ncbi:MAG: type II secretion system protein [Rickettsiales bacterium]|jgi:competence protein ComGC|nr:type II secretion system protein [Rickettsiales bacterium]